MENEIVYDPETKNRYKIYYMIDEDNDNTGYTTFLYPDEIRLIDKDSGLEIKGDIPEDVFERLYNMYTKKLCHTNVNWYK